MEALIPVFRETQVQLEGIWRTVGLSHAEQKAQIEILLKEVEETFKRKVASETALMEAYKDEIIRLKEDIAIVIRRIDPAYAGSSGTNSTAAATTAVKIEVPPTEKTPLVRELTWLRAKYEELDAKRSTLQREVEEKMITLHSMLSEMGETPPEGFQDVGFYLPGRKEAFEKQIQTLVKERASREREIHLVMERAAKLYAELEMEDMGEFDRAVASLDYASVGLSKESLDSILMREKELLRVKNERTEFLKTLGRQIQPLWDRLGVGAAERQAFFERNSGIGERVVRECREELARLGELKRTKMGEFVASARAKLNEMMEEARLAPSERFRITSGLLSKPVPSNPDVAEALLTLHEEEIGRLEANLEAIRPIIRACVRYMTLCAERLEYEALVMDSSRLLNRKRGGPSLREEEMMRKRVQVELPKLIATLEASVKEYEAKYLGKGEKLTLADVFAGEEGSVLEVVARTEREHEERVAREREQRRGERAQAGGGAQENIRGGNNIMIGASGPIVSAKVNTNNTGIATNPRVPLGVARPKNV